MIIESNNTSHWLHPKAILRTLRELKSLRLGVDHAVIGALLAIAFIAGIYKILASVSPMLGLVGVFLGYVAIAYGVLALSRWLKAPVDAKVYERYRELWRGRTRGYPTNQDYVLARRDMPRNPKPGDRVTPTPTQATPSARSTGLEALLHGVLLFLATIFQSLGWLALYISIAIIAHWGLSFDFVHGYPLSGSAFGVIPQWIDQIFNAPSLAKAINELSLLGTAAAFGGLGFAITVVEWELKRDLKLVRARAPNGGTALTLFFLFTSGLAFLANALLLLLLGYWFVALADFKLDFSPLCCTQPAIDFLQVFTDPLRLTPLLKASLGKPILWAAIVLYFVAVIANAASTAVAAVRRKGGPD